MGPSWHEDQVRGAALVCEGSLRNYDALEHKDDSARRLSIPPPHSDSGTARGRRFVKGTVRPRPFTRANDLVAERPVDLCTPTGVTGNNRVGCLHRHPVHGNHFDTGEFHRRPSLFPGALTSPARRKQTALHPGRKSTRLIFAHPLAVNHIARSGWDTSRRARRRMRVAMGADSRNIHRGGQKIASPGFLVAHFLLFVLFRLVDPNSSGLDYPELTGDRAFFQSRKKL